VVAVGGGLAIPKRTVAVDRQTSGKMGVWMADQFTTFLDLPFQNWMIVTVAMIVIAALISAIENG
jgi:hypothetical protein